MARQLGDAASLQGVSWGLGYCKSQWSGAFVAECDFHLCDEFTADLELIEAQYHRYYCHWPGEGSVPFCIIVHALWAPYLRHTECRGRACRFDFKKAAHRWYIIFCIGRRVTTVLTKIYTRTCLMWRASRIAGLGDPL